VRVCLDLNLDQVHTAARASSDEYNQGQSMKRYAQASAKLLVPQMGTSPRRAAHPK
jgi:hypothetical protein